MSTILQKLPFELQRMVLDFGPAVRPVIGADTKVFGRAVGVEFKHIGALAEEAARNGNQVLISLALDLSIDNYRKQEVICRIIAGAVSGGHDDIFESFMPRLEDIGKMNKHSFKNRFHLRRIFIRQVAFSRP